MNKKLLPLLWFSLVILSWCTTKDISSDTTIDITSQTWSVVDTGSLITWEDTSRYDGYAPVVVINQSKIWQQRIPGDWFIINDKNWKGEYYKDRNWVLISTMGVQSADIFYGYSSWNFYMDFGTEVIQLPVDGNTYISYYPQVENPNYTGTGTLQVQDKRDRYEVCKND